MNRKNSILVVDDDKSDLIYLHHLLGADYTIYVARDAKEAISRANEHRPDIILLDVIMPEINGYEVLSALKEQENTKDIPVIFTTGLSSREDETKGLDLGAEDYIIKPFNDAIVKLRVRNQIRIVNQMHMLDKRFKQQILMTSIAQSFLTDEHTDVLFTKTLRMIGEFMEIAQVLLYRLDEDGATFVCTNEWFDPGLSIATRVGSKLSLEGPMRSFIDSLSTSGELNLHSNGLDTMDNIMPYRGSFQNYIATPIFTKGKICAFLDFSRETGTMEWKDSEINFACLTASILSEVFERDAIEHDLNTVLKLQSELVIAKEQAEHSSRAKSDFLSRMSHEMRTPMNAIINLSALAHKTDDQAKKDDYFIKIDNASRGLMRLIDDVLDITDIDEGKLILAPSEFNFAAMLKNVIGQNTVTIDKHQTVETDVDPSIPETLICDDKLLAKVIDYLLVNASKFSRENSIIQFKAFVLNTIHDELTVQVEIIDTGIGISADQQKNLFTAFEQVDGGISRKYGGAGLGLYMSKTIVEMMGGEIWVESEIDKGSKFAFTFRAQVKSTDENDDAPVSFIGKTALLVEDVEINREIVIALLEDSQMNIVCAENGREAVEFFSTNPGKYDVIFMDINMPEMNGIEATRSIRALEAPDGTRVPIIAMTANVLKNEVELYLEAGMDDHIGKPIDIDILIKKISKYTTPDYSIEKEMEDKERKSDSDIKFGIAWDDSLLTGNDIVDTQHRQIFTLLSRLVGACEDGTALEKLRETLDALVDYTVKHFADEEALQIKCNYPGYIKHREMHEDFKKTVGRLAQRFAESGSSAELNDDLNIVLIKWLVQHIRNEDKNIGEYIRLTAFTE